MSNGAKTFVIFSIGAICGAATSWRYAKKKYEEIAQEEIDSVKEVFSNRPNVENSQKFEDSREKAALAKNKPDIVDYAALAKRQGYTDYSNTTVKEKPSKMDRPYVISPEEFGEFDEYESVSLVYYDDQVLADENDELVEDVEDTIGFDSLARFGEYEDDSVFVRNDRLRCDYEILRDQRRYSDVVGGPHQTEE